MNIRKDKKHPKYICDKYKNEILEYEFGIKEEK